MKSAIYPNTQKVAALAVLADLAVLNNISIRKKRESLSLTSRPPFTSFWERSIQDRQNRTAPMSESYRKNLGPRARSREKNSEAK